MMAFVGQWMLIRSPICRFETIVLSYCCDIWITRVSVSFMVVFSLRSGHLLYELMRSVRFRWRKFPQPDNSVDILLAESDISCLSMQILITFDWLYILWDDIESSGNLMSEYENTARKLFSKCQTQLVYNGKFDFENFENGRNYNVCMSNVKK